MCDAIRIAQCHPQIASDAKKCFSLANAKTHSLDLKSQENARNKTCENPAMLACNAKSRGVFSIKIERCEMPAIRTPVVVLPAMRAPRDAKSLAMWVERCEPLHFGCP